MRTAREGAGPHGPAAEMVETRSESAATRHWAAAMHASALIGFLIPFGNVLAPLALWLIARRRSAYVDEQGREALNFHLSIVLYLLVGAVLLLVPPGLVIILAAGALMLAMPIVAAVRAARSEVVHYPLSIRFLPWTAEESRGA